MTPAALLILYLVFRAKHVLCDFFLQTDWMAMTKGTPGREGYRALISHTGIHAAGTLFIVLLYAPSLWWLAGVDFILHSVIDRVKGTLTYRKQWQAKDTVFWWAYGLDQEAHNLSHLAYILVILFSLGGLTA